MRSTTPFKPFILAALFLCLPIDNALAQQWASYPDTQRARFEASAVQYNDDIYVFNGFGRGLQIETAIEKFDAGTRTWSVVGATSVTKGNAVTHNGIVRIGDDVWIIGGRIGNHPGTVSNAVWIYNLGTGQWRSGPSLPTPSAAGGAALVNNRIHWIGGLDPQANCDVGNHFVYDLAAPSAGWQDLTATAPMPVPRNHFATVVLDGIIYTIGGQFGHDNCPNKPGRDTDLVHAYNPQTTQWSQKASLPTIRSHTEPSTFVWQGAIYLVGAQFGTAEVLRYTPQQNTWTKVMDQPELLLAPVARMVDNRLVIAGGGAPDHKNPITTVRASTIAGTGNDIESTETAEPGTTELASGEALIALEAEYFDTRDNTATHSWTTTNLSASSNDAAMISSPDIGALSGNAGNSPSMAYYAVFDRPGVWYLWVRGWGNTNAQGEGSSDSVHAGLNGTLQPSADKIDQFPAGWHWSNHTRDQQRATLTVPSAGMHAFNVWMREDGLAIDKFILTTDPDYVPSGVGPARTDGSSVSNDTGSDDDNDTPSDEDTDVTPSTPDDDTRGAFHSIDGLVAVEVEHYATKTATGTHQWVADNKPNASAGGAMTTTPDAGLLKAGSADSPAMHYPVYFDKAGTYTVWLRGWGDTVGNEGKSDSAHVGINGNLSTAKAIQNFPAGWHWSNTTRGGASATITVPGAGLHTVTIWMREDGLSLDKLILSNVAGFNPTGTGPGETHSDSTSGNDDSAEEDVTEEDVTEDDVANDNTAEDDTAEDTNADTTLIAIEIEHYVSKTAASNRQWVADNKANASAGGSMITTPDTGMLKLDASGSPAMHYPIRFEAAGTYSVWLRGWGDTVGGEGKSDSVHVGIDGKLGSAKAMEHFPAGWHWSNQKRGGGSATLTVPSAGVHTVTIWMREDGLSLDKLVLSRDASYAPSGAGPEETADVLEDSGESEPSGDPTSDNTSDQPSDNTGATARIASAARWQKVTTANGSVVQKRHEAGGVEFNGKLYVLGGRGTRAVSMYDPQTRKWTQKSAPPIELNHFQPVAWGNRIWVLGAFTGKYPGETPVPHIYTYTPATDTWQKAGTIPANRRRGSAAAVVHDGAIYLVGGNTNGHKPGAKPWFDRFDPATGNWQVLPDAGAARDHATAAVSNNRLVVAAGRQSAYPNTFGNMLGQTDVYNFGTGTWSTGRAIPTRRAGTMTVSVGNEIIVIGGESQGVSVARNSVEAYDVTANSWRSLDSLNTGRHSGAAAVVGNHIHVVSGSEKLGGAPESTAHETLAISN